MGIYIAEKQDMPWVNEQYEQAGFVPSHYDHEHIAIVTYNDQFAGVGRLVYVSEDEAEMGGIYILEEFRGLALAHQLVEHLVQTARDRQLQQVYCLPFEELLPFYEKFGFKPASSTLKSIHTAVAKKHQWCLDNYDKNVLLLTLI